MHRIRHLPGIAIILWMAVVISAYYLNHKPFSISTASNIVQAIVHLSTAILIIVVVGGIGRAIRRSFNGHPGTRIALDASLGLGILGLFILFVGWAFGINTWAFWGGLVLLIIVLRTSICQWLMDWRLLFSVKLDQYTRIILAFSGMILLMTGFVSLSMPLKFDALVYHLTIPQNYIDLGHIRYLPENFYWGMPEMAEMLFTLAIALAGVQTATCLGYLLGVIGLIGVWGVSADRFDTKSAGIAIASLLCGYTLYSSLAWGYVDWFCFLFGAGFFISIDQWVQNSHPTDIILAGVFAGFAAGTKYSSGILGIIGVFIIFGIGWKRRKVQLKPFLYFSISALLFFSPWLIKNVFATGNPIYPIMFPSGAVNAERLKYYQNQPIWGGLKELLLLPWGFTISGVEGGEGFGASIGPLLLSLGLFSWMGWREHSKIQKSTISLAWYIVLSGLIIWAVASRFSGFLIQTRLYYVIFPAIGFLAAAAYYGIERVELPGIRVWRIVQVLVIMTLGFSVLEAIISELSSQSFSQIFGTQTQEEYLQRNLGWYVPAMDAITALPDNTKTIMLWEAREYYCLPKCVGDQTLDRWKLALSDYSSVDAILSHWRKEGVTNILVYQGGADFFRDGHGSIPYSDFDFYQLNQLSAELQLKDDFGGVYRLYTIKP